jgi:hypothetical protein
MDAQIAQADHLGESLRAHDELAVGGGGPVRIDVAAGGGAAAALGKVAQAVSAWG